MERKLSRVSSSGQKAAEAWSKSMRKQKALQFIVEHRLIYGCCSKARRSWNKLLYSERRFIVEQKFGVTQGQVPERKKWFGLLSGTGLDIQSSIAASIYCGGGYVRRQALKRCLKRTSKRKNICSYSHRKSAQGESKCIIAALIRVISISNCLELTSSLKSRTEFAIDPIN